MAIILKETKTYSPHNNMGLDLTGSEYYGVIDDVLYDKKSKQCFFSVDVYANAESGQQRKEQFSNISVVDRINFNFNDATFDSDIGNDGLTITQAYTKALETLTDWQSDE